MKISFFFRKQNKNQHSIEVQFNTLQSKLHKTTEVYNKYSKYLSKNIFKIVYNTLEATFRQSEINHITGDIHYVALFLKKRKTILTIHDVESSFKSNIIKSYFIEFLWFILPAKRVKYITVISEFTKKQLLDYINVKPDKVFVIPNCISDNLVYCPKKFNVEKPVLLQIGTKSNKNIPNLIKSIKNISCKLIIIGKLSENQRTILFENKIDFENKYNLPHQELIEYYKKSDILTFVSTYEGFGVPIIEANAVGIPVITSNISPMTEVSDGSAILVDPFNTSQIEAGIIKVINDASLRKTLIHKGLENAKKYRAEHIAQQYSELYKKIMNK